MKRRRREDLRILLVEGEWCGDGWAAQTWTLGEQHSRSCFIRVGIDESRGRIYFMGSWYGQRVVVAAIHSIVGDNWGVEKRSQWCCRCLIWHWGCGCGCSGVLWKMNEEAGRRWRRPAAAMGSFADLLLSIFQCDLHQALSIHFMSDWGTYVGIKEFQNWKRKKCIDQRSLWHGQREQWR